MPKRQLVIHKKQTIKLAALFLTCFAFNTALPLNAKNNVVEFAKYFNPVQSKSYLNESQDRIIKKGNFKTSNMPSELPVINRETGLFVLINKEDLNKDEKIALILQEPLVNGLSVIIPWNMLEPQDDEFNWKTLDHLLNLAKENDKTLIVRVSTFDGKADEAPVWVYESGAKSVEYKADGKILKYPIFWDTSYIANWRNFISAFGKRYDKNPYIHSVGITGGGLSGGTSLLPFQNNKENQEWQAKLTKNKGMTPKQLVDNWKHITDLYAKAFNVTPLNFDIEAALPGKKGQDVLDETTDYLIYRFGERVYLTRQNVADCKHGFDQYHVMLKFRNDTLTGYQITPAFDTSKLGQLVQQGFNDGISFAEIPMAMFESQDNSVQTSLKDLAAHIGYQIMAQKATVQSEIEQAEPLKASFSFINLGDACPIKPKRNLDKDVPSSYRILIELRNSQDKAVVNSLHTPLIPTNEWKAGKPYTWQEELKMPNKLEPGDYSAYMSLIDGDSKRKLKFLDGISHEKPELTYYAFIGKIHVNVKNIGYENKNENVVK